jgi:hypothetical protein
LLLLAAQAALEEIREIMEILALEVALLCLLQGQLLGIIRAALLRVAVVVAVAVVLVRLKVTLTAVVAVVVVEDLMVVLEVQGAMAPAHQVARDLRVISQLLVMAAPVLMVVMAVMVGFLEVRAHQAAPRWAPVFQGVLAGLLALGYQVNLLLMVVAVLPLA